MKIYICTDLEGISGVVIKNQGKSQLPEYAVAVRLLLGDLNAAIEGALSGGADEIIVSDSHSSGFNLPLEDLHPAAEYVIGYEAPSKPRFHFLDESVDGVILLGYHAMAGTGAAVLDHTMAISAWRNVEINGIPVGEAEIDAAIAGEFGVPVIMASGDDKLCSEVLRLMPWASTACVKKGLGRERALIKAPVKARELIFAAAEKAVRNVGNCKPFKFDAPVEIKIEYDVTEHVDRMRFDGKDVIRVDARTVLFRGKDYQDAIYRII